MAPKAEEEGAESSSSEANGPAAGGEGSDAVGGASDPGRLLLVFPPFCFFMVGHVVVSTLEVN